jgi:hypothetical protein
MMFSMIIKPSQVLSITLLGWCIQGVVAVAMRHGRINKCDKTVRLDIYDRLRRQCAWTKGTVMVP